MEWVIATNEQALAQLVFVFLICCRKHRLWRFRLAQRGTS